MTGGGGPVVVRQCGVFYDGVAVPRAGNLVYKNPFNLVSIFPPHFHLKWLPTRESRSSKPSPSQAKSPLVPLLFPSRPHTTPCFSQVTSSLSTTTDTVAKKDWSSAPSPTVLYVDRFPPPWLRQLNIDAGSSNPRSPARSKRSLPSLVTLNTHSL